MGTGKRSYAAGSFELQLDGKATTAYLKSVEGGNIKANVADEPIGADLHRIKHMTNLEIEPLSMEIGMSGCDDVLKWIRSSWKKDFSRRNGQVTHADFDLKEKLTHEFTDALICETT